MAGFARSDARVTIGYITIPPMTNTHAEKTTP